VQEKASIHWESEGNLRSALRHRRDRRTTYLPVWTKRPRRTQLLKRRGEEGGHLLITEEEKGIRKEDKNDVIQGKKYEHCFGDGEEGGKGPLPEDVLKD